MGLPELTITFVAKAQESIRRSDRGIVGMILKDIVPETNPMIVYKEKDIMESLTEDNQEQIRFALKGYINTPSKIVVYVVDAKEGDYTKALDYFALKKVTWLCCPSVETDGQAANVVEWVKEQREKRNKVKVVLPNQPADTEGVVNYTTSTVTVGEKQFTAEKFCSRIAGLLAGTPANMSSTFATLEDVTDCQTIKKEEADAAIEAGKFILYNDGEKVKVGRGVNSLITIQSGKSEEWKKIKVVETMDTINDDLKILIEDTYLGKYMNIYDNKCMVIGAIKSYLEELKKAYLLDNYNVDFNEEAIKEYLIEKKGFTKDEVENMKRTDLIQQKTDSRLLLEGSALPVDAMEDVEINFGV